MSRSPSSPAAPALALLLALGIGCAEKPPIAPAAGGEGERLQLARKLLDRQRQETAALATWADAALTAGDPLFGPRNGELAAGTEPGPALAAAGVKLADLAVEARFVNPAAGASPSWDYGIGLRDAEAEDIRIYVNAQGVWAIDYGLGDGPPRPGQSGRAASLDRKPGAANTLRLVAADGGALFFVNGAFTAWIHLDGTARAGEVYLGAGFVEGGLADGPVRYENWRVWEVGG